MVVVSTPPHAEFGPNDHREGAPHFIIMGGTLLLLGKDRKILILSRLHPAQIWSFRTHFSVTGWHQIQKLDFYILNF